MYYIIDACGDAIINFTSFMAHLIQLLIIITAGACVAIADVLLKRAAINAHSLIDVLRHPLIIPTVLLYICQIVLFAYVFVKRWELGIVGILQMACYAAIVIISGTLFFQEKLTFTHGLGIAAALVGVILMNL